MRDFDNDLRTRVQRDREDFDRDFTKAKRMAKIWAVIVIPLYLIGALLILGLLAVALYAAASYVGLV